MLETGWSWETVGALELSKALALTEYRFVHPSADALVASYLGYRAPSSYREHQQLSEDERARWASTGVRFSPTAPPLDKLPPILRNKFPFLNQPKKTTP